MTARDVMTPNPMTVTPQATVAQVFDLMRELDIRHVPVVRGGALVGMLSDRDLAAFDVPRLVLEQGADALRRQLSTPVIKVMSSDVIFVEPDTELSDVVGLMLDSKVGAIPVVRPDTRGVIGIVSYIDVLRSVQDLLEEEPSAPRMIRHQREVAMRRQGLGPVSAVIVLVLLGALPAAGARAVAGQLRKIGVEVAAVDFRSIPGVASL